MFLVTSQSFGITEPQQSWCWPSIMPSTDLNNESQTKISTSQQKTEQNEVNFSNILFWKCYLEYCVSAKFLHTKTHNSYNVDLSICPFYWCHGYFFFLLIFPLLIHNERHRKFKTNGICAGLSFYLPIFNGKHKHLRYNHAFRLLEYRKEQRTLFFLIWDVRELQNDSR